MIPNLDSNSTPLDMLTLLLVLSPSSSPSLPPAIQKEKSISTERERERERVMGSKEKKKAALQEKLEILRTITKSNAVNQASIIVDATKYIKELKQKVEDQQELEQDSTMPKVTITTLEKGFLINVLCEKRSPGLLVSMLEAFEDLGLEVLDANASCCDTFRLEAIGGESQESVDAQMVRQVVHQAIKKCMETDE
ncbi:hypothetical protein LUZ60_015402 [Juncus effusus]|nr:hypothetical protein LUZ60_015402 [Juncus effusus]